MTVLFNVWNKFEKDALIFTNAPNAEAAIFPENLRIPWLLSRHEVTMVLAM